MKTEAELIERFLDHLIDPIECIDTYGRTYLDDLEHIVVENHQFDFKTQKFPDSDVQEWFDRIRSEFKFDRMESLISYVRANLAALSLANLRPRSTFRNETIFEAEASFQDLKIRGDSLERHNEFQRQWSLIGVRNIPVNEISANYYELYMSSDRVNPWTYVLRREMGRGNLSADDSVICIGNRWLGEILYFRQNLGLKKTKGVDLFSSDPELVTAADMHSLPYEDQSIKMIFARGLINKTYDIRIWAKEMLRVLKKDGFLVIETPSPYQDGVSRLGRTDIKSAKNVLRLFRGKVRRIVYLDEMKSDLFSYDATRFIRLCVQIDGDGWNQAPIVEPFSQLRFRVYDFCRRSFVALRWTLSDSGVLRRRFSNLLTAVAYPFRRVSAYKSYFMRHLRTSERKK